MKTPVKYSFLLICISILSVALYGQNNSIGINTLNPNPNAVLELVSPNNNQGLLLPRLTSSQRTALSSLTLSEQGLLIYDITMQSLYCWDGASWNTILGKTYSAGTGITIDVNNAISGFDGNYNSLTNLPSPFNGDYNNLINKPIITTYTAGAGININASNNIINSLPDQVISLSGAGSTLISGTYPNFTITSTDNQTLTLLTNTLSLTNGGSVSLAGYLDNTDAQNVSITGNAISISGGTGFNLTSTAPANGEVLKWNGANWVPGADIDTKLTEAEVDTYAGNNGYLTSFTEVDGSITNEIQNVSISGNAVSITGGTGFNLTSTAPANGEVLKWNSGSWVSGVDTDTKLTETEVDGFVSNNGYLTTFTEVDGSVTNEIQDLTISGNILSLSGDGTTVDLSAINTDNQDLALAVNSLSITNDITPVDLTPYLDNTDAQAISLSANTLSITGNAGTVNLAGYLDNTDAQDLTISGNTLSLTGDATNVEISTTVPTDKQILTWNGTTSKWEAKGNYTAGTGITIDATNNINSLWATASGSDVILANSLSNVGIGSAPLAGYKLFVNGKLQTAGINELSDKRWKTDINPIEYSLDIVKQLQGVTYKWNINNFPDKNFETGIQMGLIAQEVEKVLPYMVDTDENGYKSVEYSHLVALLVEAIKEQQILIKQQQNEIQSLDESKKNIWNMYKSLETRLEKQQTQIALLVKYMESSNTVQQTK